MSPTPSAAPDERSPHAPTNKPAQAQADPVPDDPDPRQARQDAEVGGGGQPQR